MSLDNPLDARIEQAIESELSVHRDKSLLEEADRAEIAKFLRIRLQRAGVLADVKKTTEREKLAQPPPTRDRSMPERRATSRRLEVDSLGPIDD